jgi:translation elongation factor EF-4
LVFLNQNFIKIETLEEGMIGYLATGIKDPGILKIGETITFDLETPPIEGYQEPKPVVFASVFHQQILVLKILKTV